MKKAIKAFIQKNNERAKAERISYFAVFLILLSLVSLGILIVSIFSKSFADFFNRYVSSFFRATLALITNLLPFSLAECLIILSPVILVVVIILAIKYKSDSFRSVLSYCISAVAVLSLFFTSFVFTFGVGYHTSGIDEMLSFDRIDINRDDLKATALLLAEKINDELSEIEFEEKSFSVMPYSIHGLNKELNAAYDSFGKEYGFLQSLYSNAKPVMLSRAMSYTHITGVYTYFTGEANINVNFPDYTIPFTAAHELAHQRGVAREDEANFIAFLVCLESDDAYMRYSGYLNVFEYVAAALYDESPSDYRAVLGTLDRSVLYELNAYSDFFEDYSDSTAGKISSGINDAYLKTQGTVGTSSYGMVVDLTVSYFKNLHEIP